MNLEEFLSAARDYVNLGDPVRNQLDAIFDGDPIAEQNLNALRRILAFLDNNGFGIDAMADEIRTYLKEQGQ